MFGKPVSLTRNQAQPGFPPDALARIFRLAPEGLPKYVGATNERGGFSIYQVQKVVMPPPPEAAKLNAAGSRLGDQLGRELFGAYLAALKAKTEIKINQESLTKK